jgi:hypothetical protein
VVNLLPVGAVGRWVRGVDKEEARYLLGLAKPFHPFSSVFIQFF